jgi:hypothetical protein
MRFLSLLCPQVVNSTDLALTVYSGIPDDVILIDSQPRRQAGLSFWQQPTTKCLLLKQKSIASDMSDLAYEQELGEGGEVDEGPLEHCRKFIAPIGWQGNAHRSP